MGYLSSRLLVGVGLWLSLFGKDSGLPMANAIPSSLLQKCFHMDALHYRNIVLNGYAFDVHRKSPVAFFPLYPLLARGVMLVTGCPVEVALLLVANLALLGAFIAFAYYARLRFANMSDAWIGGCVMLLAAWPTGFFAHMAYAEGLLLLLMLLVFIGMERSWPMLVLALLTALATATRPVGIALLVPMVMHVFQRYPSAAQRCLAWLVYVPIGLSGLLVYMAFLAGAFDDPLAFARTQEHWTMGHKSKELQQKLISLFTFEPVWGAWSEGSVHYWKQHDTLPWYSSMIFMNPIYFLIAVLSLFLGVWFRKLNSKEWMLGFLLVAIPYLTRAYEMSMGSMGRFVSVIFPMFFSLTVILAALPWLVRLGIGLLLAVGMVSYSYHYALGYAIF